MPGFAPLRKPLQESTLWIVLDAVLVAAIGVTFLFFLRGGTAEVMQANRTGQRAVVDALSGAVSLGAPKPAAQAFDVADHTDTTPKAATAAAPAADGAPAHEAAPPAMGNADAPPDAAPLRTQPLASSLPAVAEGRTALIPAPAPEVSEKVDGLVLPKRNGENSPATLYAQRFQRTPEQRLLSFVVLDAGLSTQSLPLLMALPKEVTLAFSPYSPDAQERIALFRKAGFEVWTMLPTQGAHYPQDDPGPLGLVANLPKDELMRRLHAVMAEGAGSVGMVLPPDETISAKSTVFSPLLAEIDGRGLSVLTTNPARTTKQVAGGAPHRSLFARSDVMLDATPDAAEITRKLSEIGTVLQTEDSLIVTLSARPQSLVLLQQWLKEHPPEAPVTLAPLSAYAQPKEPPAAAPEQEAPSGGHGAPAEAKAEAKPSGHGGGDAKKSGGGGHH